MRKLAVGVVAALAALLLFVAREAALAWEESDRQADERGEFR